MAASADQPEPAAGTEPQEKRNQAEQKEQEEQKKSSESKVRELEAAAAAKEHSRPPSINTQVSPEVNTTKPQDFEGEVTTNDEIPSTETLKKIENYIVLDKDGKTHAFKSLYSGRNVARRVLVIFVRHFFCGNCQQYLYALSESITPEALLSLPVSTFIAVVGCGDPNLIDMYVRETNCPFPVYTDPTRSLFDALGMVRTLALGAKPAYVRNSFMKLVADGVMQGLRQIPRGLATKAGDQRQVGGEFLFEPFSLMTPMAPPGDGRGILEQMLDEGKNSVEDPDDEAAVDVSLEEKRVTWCHRMRSTRDHSEIPELMEILGLDGQGKPIKDKERWARALQQRKGTGISMAAEMKAQ